MSYTPLERLLFGHSSASSAPRLVVGRHPLRFNIDELRAAMDRLRGGDSVGYAVPLDGPRFMRLLTLATLSLRLRRVQRAIERGGLTVTGAYGVDPRFESPALVYQLNSAASRYADCCLRPRGPVERLRRIAARVLGCDPAVGAVVVTGRKP